jgi:hypothetical protein
VPAKQQIINVLPIELATQNELSANGTDWKVQKRRSPQHARGLKNCSGGGSRRARAQIKTAAAHVGMLAQATIIDEQELAPLQAALMTARVLNVKRARRRLSCMCRMLRSDNNST